MARDLKQNPSVEDAEPRTTGSRLQKNHLHLAILQYELIADGYVCTTIDAETIRQRAGMLLKKSIRNIKNREAILDDLFKWCQNAKHDDSLTRDEFSVTVKDPRKEKEKKKKRSN